MSPVLTGNITALSTGSPRFATRKLPVPREGNNFSRIRRQSLEENPQIPHAKPAGKPSTPNEKPPASQF
jgi:hypothetical protein